MCISGKDLEVLWDSMRGADTERSWIETLWAEASLWSSSVQENGISSSLVTENRVPRSRVLVKLSHALTCSVVFD